MINQLIWILVAFALVLFNAFFVAAEFAMVKLRATRVEEIKSSHGFRGKILYHIHAHLDAYLSACQLGITFASLGLGWIGEPAFALLIEPLLFLTGIHSAHLITLISFFVAFSLISFLHIVVGELMPKSLAIRQSEKVSLWTATPLYGFYWLMYPAIWLLNTCSNFLLKMVHLDATHQGEHFYSTQEIKLLLNASHLHGELTEDEVDIIERTFDLADLKVTEVMRFYEDMIMLDLTQPLHQIMETIIKYRYSRYPVYDPVKKDIIGIIHVKDMLPVLFHQGKIESLTALIRPVLKVSRRLPALDLLRQFREGMPHFALVYRGEETLLGFVTLDNLLQVLIGRIKDEFHRTQVDWITNEDGSLTVSGKCSIYALEQVLDRDIEVDDDVDTLNGLFFHRLGYVPKKDEQIDFPEFSAKIEKAEASKVLKVKVFPKSKSDV